MPKNGLSTTILKGYRKILAFQLDGIGVYSSLFGV